MSPEEIISVVQAFKDGKKIQLTSKSNGMEHGWIADGWHVWNFEKFNYRVKPEPRELWCVNGGYYKVQQTDYTGTPLPNQAHYREVL